MPAPNLALRRDIDGLRALAVILVIAHHVAPAMLTGGFVGVDVSFVISGFLITRLIDEAQRAGTFSYVEFVWRRARRILPALLTVLVATLLLGMCILTGPELVSLARHVAASSLSASNLLLWSEVGYFDPRAALQPLRHLWSLGVEAQFYLLWPAFLAILPLQRRTRALSVAALVGLSLMLSENLAYPDPAQAFYLLQSRAWELGVGGLLALILPMIPDTWTLAPRDDQRARAAASVIGLMLIMYVAVVAGPSSAWPGLAALAPVLGTALLIAAGPDALLNRAVLSRRVAQWIGQRSYSLYLWHWPPLAFLHILAPERSIPEQTVTWIAAWMMLPVIAIANATLHHVERPVRAVSERVEKRTPIYARHLLPFGVAMALLAMTADTIARSHGLPTRYGTAGVDAVATLREASPDSITAYDQRAARCRLADKGNATWCWRIPGHGMGIAVFGDSHAEVIFAGLADLRQPRPLFLTGRKGCAPILQPEPTSDRIAETCRRAAIISHEAIRSDPTIGTVLLVSRGPAYITGAGFGVDSQRPIVPVALRASSADPRPLERAYEAGLERSIQSLSDAGKRVILVIGVPEPGFLPEECLIGRPMGLRDVRMPCALPRAVVDSRNAQYRRLVGSLVARNPRLEVFDAQSVFCDGALCHAQRGNRLLYRDGTDLTLFGSRLVTEQLRPVLARPTYTATLADATPAR